MPFAIEVDGRFAGQVTVNNIVRGSAQFASIGYWLDQRRRRSRRDADGRGDGDRPLLHHRRAAPDRDLHPPENTNSLRVVEKLGLHEVGYAPRFLHIDGDWRDHRIYAVTVEDVPHGTCRLSAGSRGGVVVRASTSPCIKVCR